MSRSSRLVEPAFHTAPPWEKTLGPEVADLARLANFPPDPEQELVLDELFAIGADDQGKVAAFEVGVVACRQNLKTGVFKQAALGWLFLTDQRLVVWSAHEFRTAQEAFRDMKQLIEGCPELDRRVKQVYNGNGDESIELFGDRRLIFKARTKSGGRGLTGDKVVLDEAFALQPAQMGALLPTLSARPDPQVVYGSSAGLVDSHVLRGVRDRGRTPGADSRLAYLEWTAEGHGCQEVDCKHDLGTAGCALDDESLWQLANPALGRRINVESIRAERKAMAAIPEEFARERLGWWDDPVGTGAVLPNWLQCATDREPPGPGAIAVAVSVDRAWSSVGVAAAGEPAHVGSYRRARGTAWVVAEAKRIQEQQQVPVVVDGKSPAGPLIDPLRDAGVDVLVAGTEDYVQACADFYDLVEQGQLEHGNYDDLNEAVRVATWRTVGDRQVWARKNGDVSMLEAVTLALWGAQQSSSFNIW